MKINLVFALLTVAACGGNEEMPDAGMLDAAPITCEVKVRYPEVGVFRGIPAIKDVCETNLTATIDVPDTTECHKIKAVALHCKAECPGLSLDVTHFCADIVRGDQSLENYLCDPNWGCEIKQPE